MPKGTHSSRSSSYSRSGVPFCWGSGCGWFWSSGCQVTGPCESVIAGWSVATGWVLRVGSSAVVAIYFNRKPSEHRRNMVSGRGVGWSFLFYVSTYPCPLAYCCCVLVHHSERDVPPHPFSRVWLGEDARTMQHRVWRALLRDLGDGADVREVRVSPCLCCDVKLIQRQYCTGWYHSVEVSGCCWSIYVCCVSPWMSACSYRGFRKQLGKWLPCKGDWDGFVVRPSIVGILIPSLQCIHFRFLFLKEVNGQVSVPRSAYWHEI